MDKYTINLIHFFIFPGCGLCFTFDIAKSYKNNGNKTIKLQFNLILNKVRYRSININ